MVLVIGLGFTSKTDGMKVRNNKNIQTNRWLNANYY